MTRTASPSWATETVPSAALLLLLLSAVDGVLTLVSVGLGMAYEANPVMGVLYSAHPLVFYVVKQALVYCSCLLLLSAARRSPRATAMALVSCCMLYSAVVGWHMHVLGVT